MNNPVIQGQFFFDLVHDPIGMTYISSSCTKVYNVLLTTMAYYKDFEIEFKLNINAYLYYNNNFFIRTY